MREARQEIKVQPYSVVPNCSVYLSIYSQSLFFFLADTVVFDRKLQNSKYNWRYFIFKVVTTTKVVSPVGGLAMPFSQLGYP